MAELSTAELMSRMPAAFRPDAAQEVNTTLQFHLTGADGGDWVAKIHDGTCTVNPGTAENPNVTLTADAQDYKDVIMGKTNAMQAFMQGKLRLAGDLAMAMKIPNLFKMG